MRHSLVRLTGVAASLLAAQALTASAQSLGTFTWQLQPYCNRVTAQVVQNGGSYTLDGFDDQCGAGQRAPVVGIAVPNPDGTIGFGLTVVTVPGGRPVHIDARITLAALGGAWSDSAGNNGTLVFNGAAAGSARPAPTTGVPAGSITASSLAPGAVTTAALAAGSVTATQLAAGAVTTTAIANGTVGSADINTAQVQRRITTECATGTFYTAVSETGTATCDDGSDLTSSAAFGAAAMRLATGGFNSAFGPDALENVTGTVNVAVGGSALRDLTSGTANSVVGSGAAFRLTSGAANAILGRFTITNATTASDNAVLGAFAGGALVSGSRNVLIGSTRGGNLVAGNDNVYLDASGAGDESSTIRVGRGVHTRTFVAGVRGITTATAAIPVLVGTDGQLGTVSSSRRFKDDIRDMGGISARLLQLRPVTFRYAQPAADGSKPLDFGLIAEEVAEVFPELAVAGADGRIETVAYHKLPALLLNELQRLQRVIDAQAARLGALESSRR